MKRMHWPFLRRRRDGGRCSFMRHNRLPGECLAVTLIQPGLHQGFTKGYGANQKFEAQSPAFSVMILLQSSVCLHVCTYVYMYACMHVCIDSRSSSKTAHKIALYLHPSHPKTAVPQSGLLYLIWDRVLFFHARSQRTQLPRQTLQYLPTQRMLAGD